VEPTYFAGPAELRAWFEVHHEGCDELYVGYHRKGTGTPSITWPESVDEALCFGWIDGVRRGVDERRYMIRFTPRRKHSTWSAANIARARELIELGRMTPAGLRAFEARRADRSAIYSYEQRQDPQLSEEELERFRANAAAWAWFEARPPGYRRTATWWVVSAKRPDTRRRRLERLIEDSANGRTIALLTRPSRQQ
jgi:uncharacterized protein YdeI (YjbR/CyaY-like superfamily)